MSSMICGETSDPQYRDLTDIIQRLRKMIPIFDSLVSILPVTKSELIWYVSLSHLAAPDVIHQPPLGNLASVFFSPLLTTLVPDNVDISIPLVSSPTTVTILKISYRSFLYIIQYLRELISIFDSLVSLMILTTSEIA